MIRALFGHDGACATWIGLADSLDDDECGITQEDVENALLEGAAENSAEYCREISRAVNNARDVDSLDGRIIKDYVWPHDERAEILAEVLSALSHFGLFC